MKASLWILTLIFSVGCAATDQDSKAVSAETVATPEVEAEKIAVSVSPTPAKSSAVDQNVVNEIKRIVGKILGLDPKAIDPSAPLSMQKIAADELDVVEIIMGVEDHFKIEIKDEDIGGGSDISQLPKLSVNKIAEVVEQKQKIKSRRRK